MSLILREMQVKTTVRHCLTPVRMAVIDNQQTRWARMCAVGGMQIGAATMENSVEVPQKI